MEWTVENVVKPGYEFALDSKRFIERCHKPDLKEFKKNAYAVAWGILIMGSIGYFVKLIHIPVHNVLLGAA